MNELNVHNLGKGIVITARCPVCGRWANIKQFERYMDLNNIEIGLMVVHGLGQGKGFVTRRISESELAPGSFNIFKKIREWFKAKFKNFGKEGEIWQGKSKSGLTTMGVHTSSAVIESYTSIRPVPMYLNNPVIKVKAIWK